MQLKIFAVPVYRETWSGAGVKQGKNVWEVIVTHGSQEKLLLEFSTNLRILLTLGLLSGLSLFLSPQEEKKNQVL